MWGINEQRLGDRSARHRRVREFLAMLSAWLPLARRVKELGGSIAWEWPRSCWLWSHPRVQSILEEFDPESVVFDGCAFGLKAFAGRDAGKRITKQ